VLVGGVPDGGAAQPEQLDREVRGGERDPPAAVDNLLAQVEQQPAVVLQRRRSVLDPADDRHPGQRALQLRPDFGQFAEHPGNGWGVVGRRRAERGCRQLRRAGPALGANAGQLGEGHGEAAGLRNDQENPVTAADAGPGGVQHHEDARRARVPGRVQVRVPALVIGRVSGSA
jgi:hypothetical protein